MLLIQLLKNMVNTVQIFVYRSYYILFQTAGPALILRIMRVRKLRREVFGRIFDTEIILYIMHDILNEKGECDTMKNKIKVRRYFKWKNC